MHTIRPSKVHCSSPPVRRAVASLCRGSNAASANRVDVCGTIPSDTVWTADNVYVQTCGVTISASVTVTVEPGTIVKLVGADFIVNGALLVEGEPAAPIVFTSFSDDANGGDTNGDGPSQGAPGNGSHSRFQPGATAASRMRSCSTGRKLLVLRQQGADPQFHQ